MLRATQFRLFSSFRIPCVLHARASLVAVASSSRAGVLLHSSRVRVYVIVYAFARSRYVACTCREHRTIHPVFQLSPRRNRVARPTVAMIHATVKSSCGSQHIGKRMERARANGYRRFTWIAVCRRARVVEVGIEG